MLPFDFTQVDRIICQPNPAFFKDATQRNELYRRNQWQLRMYLALLIAHIPLLVLQMEIHYHFVVFTFFNFFSFICFCRTRIWISYSAYTISLLAFQVSLLRLRKDYAICGLLGAFLTPSFVLITTQRLIYFIFSFLGQLILLHMKYRIIFHEILLESDEAEFSNRITNWTMLILSLLVLTYCFIHEQFKRSKQHLQQECGRLNLFIQTFSHELRNPLTSLLGNIEIALKQVLPYDTVELIESAKVSGELLLQLVNNILDSGKDQLEVGLTSASMGETMIKVWRISKDLIKKKGLNGFLKIDKKLPPLLLIDPYRMAQLLLNLLNNAVKFTQKGYVWATLEWIPNERLSDKCFRPLPYDEEGLFEKNENMKMLSRDVDNSEFFSYVNSTNNHFKNLNLNQDSQGYGVIKIVIKDTGCGIKKDDLHKVFEKYIQVHNDPCQRKIGSGLGLFITKEICERMGGEIRAYSKEGQGTTFIACIPSYCSVASLKMPSITEIIRNAAHVRFHGLLIDNNLGNLNLLSNFIIKMHGVVLDRAQNCFDAFEKYRHLRKKREEFQVVLLDVDSPILDGKGICKKIREYEYLQQLSPIKIILICDCQQGVRTEEFLDQSGPYRANAILKKPLLFENFTQLIENTLV